MIGKIEKLLKNPVSFLGKSSENGGDVAISTRIRLARNLNGIPFPAAASPQKREEVCQIVVSAAENAAALGKKRVQRFNPEQMSRLDREFLLERRLASREFIDRPQGTRLLVCPKERCSVMVNEEDQLRLQAITPGFQLEETWKIINRLDDDLDFQVDYAYDDRLGYLTSCPTNLGTGMRASVMLHLPGLVLTGQIAATIQGINKLHLAVRGIFGEGSENLGNLFQVSNQTTLGKSEEEILDALDEVITKLIVCEKNAREMAVERDHYTLLDYVGRSYGILRHSYKLSSAEALKALSGIRLGVDLKLFSIVDVDTVNELFVAAGAAHLQKLTGLELPEKERDVARAELFRKKLRGNDDQKQPIGGNN